MDTPGGEGREWRMDEGRRHTNRHGDGNINDTTVTATVTNDDVLSSLCDAFQTLPREVVEEVFVSVGYNATAAAECLLSMSEQDDASTSNAHESDRNVSSNSGPGALHGNTDTDEQIQMDEMLARQLQEEFTLEDRRIVAEQIEDELYRQRVDSTVARYDDGSSSALDPSSAALIDGVVGAVSSGVEAVSSSVGWGLAALSDTFQSTWSSIVGSGDDEDDADEDYLRPHNDGNDDDGITYEGGDDGNRDTYRQHDMSSRDGEAVVHTSSEREEYVGQTHLSRRHNKARPSVQGEDQIASIDHYLQNRRVHTPASRADDKKEK